MRKGIRSFVLMCIMMGIAGRGMALSCPDLLDNAELTAAGTNSTEPSSWQGWNDGNADPEYSVYRSSPNSWAFFTEAGIYQDVYYGYYGKDTITVGGYLYTPSGNPIGGTGTYGVIEVEFWNGTNLVTNAVCQPVIDAGSAANTWIYSSVEQTLPTYVTAIRVLSRFYTDGGGTGEFYTDDISLSNAVTDTAGNLLRNGDVSGYLEGPDGWQQWNDGSHDADYGTYRSAENSWSFWWDGGLYQDVDVSTDMAPGFALAYSAYLLNPSWDALRSGTKNGTVSLEVYQGATMLDSSEATTNINATSPSDTWVQVSGSILLPGSATTARLLIHCGDWWSGDGRFLADDASLQYRHVTAGSGSYGSGAIVQSNPAVAFWSYVAYTGSLKYARSSDAEGNGPWVTNTLLTTNIYYWGTPFPSLAVVDGNPALAVRLYQGDGDLFYFRCSSVDGTGAWSSVMVDGHGSAVNAGVDPTLLVVNGRPSISSLEDGGGVVTRLIRYYRSSTTNGLGDWTSNTVAQCLRDANTSSMVGNMDIVDGNPAIVWRNGLTNSSQIYLTLSTNVDGNGRWTNSLVESVYVNAGRPHLAVVSNLPAVTYVLNETLRYAINSSSTGTGTWSIVTVATNAVRDNVKLSVYNGNPVIAYTAKRGTTSLLGYAVSADADGLGDWDLYAIGVGGTIGTLIQHNDRPLVIHSYNGITLTR